MIRLFILAISAQVEQFSVVVRKPRQNLQIDP